MRTTPLLTVEVQNNNLRTPPDLQLKFHEASIKATIDKLLKDDIMPPPSLLRDSSNSQ